MLLDFFGAKTVLHATHCFTTIMGTVQPTIAVVDLPLGRKQVLFQFGHLRYANEVMDLPFGMLEGLCFPGSNLRPQRRGSDGRRLMAGTRSKKRSSKTFQNTLCME